jgi:hypothetical protein
MNVVNSTTYTIGRPIVEALEGQLGDIFTGNGSAPVMNQFSSACIEALYNQPRALDPGLARSMSTVIRTPHQYPVIVDSEAYLGTAYSYEMVFKMTRGYLGLPVALVLLSGVFFGGEYLADWEGEGGDLEERSVAVAFCRCGC